MAAPSIFNDVVGPVMRGPSSSHCAAALRIGKMCRDLMDGSIKRVLVEFDPEGSLATTHRSQGSDMGLFGGLLGWEAYDERLPESERYLETAGIGVTIDIREIGAAHPNTYKVTLWSPDEESHTLTALSTGGGMIQVIEIDGQEVLMEGDCFETLVFLEGQPFLEIKGESFEEPPPLSGVRYVRRLAPVLPILTPRDVQVPFLTVRDMLRYNEGKGLELWELALRYESARGRIPEETVYLKMEEIAHILRGAVRTGLKGTEYQDRLLGSQSVQFRNEMEKGRLVEGAVLNRIILYVSAIMEVKSSMGVIVAAPTAGSCGAMPGAVLGVCDALGMSEDQAIKALLGAGLMGVFISAHATFAAEVGGCQAECGSGACMAAASIVYLAGGTLAQSLSAASIALQNSLGMICDPIANRVEAPCLGKNVLAATNALSCANMALANYDHLIPLDEVIETMDRVGAAIPSTLRCTNLGGLSITPTARELESRLQSRQVFKSC